MFIPTPPAPDAPQQRRTESDSEHSDAALQGSTESHSEHSDAALQELAGYVMDCLNHGSAPADIRKSLVAKGLSEADAGAVVDQVLHHHSGGALGHDYRDVEAVQAAGRRNMAIGGIVCVIGLVVTLVTIAAAGDGGGRVIFAWGAIVFGAIQFFRGLAQANHGRS
jgi:hypothetical protein